MKQKPLFWQLFPAFLFLIFTSLFAFFLLAYRPFNQYLLEQAKSALQNQLALAKQSLLHFSSLEDTGLKKLLLAWDQDTKMRLTLIDVNGQVLIDTKRDPQTLETHADRQEIIQAMQTGRGFAIRESNSLDTELMYASTKIEIPGKTGPYILRAAVSMENIKSQVYAIYAKLFIAGGFILGFVALMSYWLSRKVSRPLESMKHQAELMANGDFTGRVKLRVSDPEEVYRLGLAMNEIAIQLDHRIETILNQKNERDAILASMVEGVLAVDPDQFIVHLNQAAAEILGVNRAQAVGMSIHEAIRLPELQEVVQRSLKKEVPEEMDITLKILRKEIILAIKSSPLRSANNKKLGAVIVFSDITHLRKLESHRRDFVANVSHELRTPLTSIRGFAETLLGAQVGEVEQKKFLEIINRHAQRLGEIIEDLLALSNLEKDTEANEIELYEQRIWPSLEAAKEMLELKATKMGVDILIKGDPSVKAKINSQLLEQAVVNLVDNALKYSDEGGRVIIHLNYRSQEVEIRVEDEGQGISQEHLPRLFERFYRIDKARSRQLGGTGLGLSIVKHVAMAHRGRVHVESQLGKGSKFYIMLPTENTLKIQTDKSYAHV